MQPWDIQNIDLNINRDWLFISIFIKSEPKRGGGDPTIGKVCLINWLYSSLPRGIICTIICTICRHYTQGAAIGGKLLYNSGTLNRLALRQHRLCQIRFLDKEVVQPQHNLLASFNMKIKTSSG